MIRYYLKTEIFEGVWKVYYIYNGQEYCVVCDYEQHAKNLFDEISAEKIGFPII